MITLLSLKIQGFASFKDEQTFFFPNKQGLYFIAGENKVQSIGANGAGKSSLFEALCFCLFGQTSSKLKQGDVKNKEYEGKCKVTLDFLDNNITKTLIREANPTKIYFIENDKKLEKTQLEVEEYLGYSITEYLYSTFIGQFSPKFFDITPLDRVEVLTKILNLGEFDEATEKAKELAKSIKEELTLKGTEIEKYLALISKSEKLIAQYKSLEEQQSVRNDEKIKELLVKKETIEKDIETHKGKLQAYEKEELLFSKEKNIVKNELTKVSSSYNEAETKLVKVCEEQQRKNKEIQHHRASIEKLSIRSICPTCNSILTEESKDKTIESFLTKIQLIEKEIEELKLAEDVLRKNYIDITNQLASVKEKLINYEVSPYSEKINELKRILACSASVIYQVDSELKELIKPLVDYTSLANKEQLHINEHNKSITDLNKQVTFLSEKKEVAEFWAGKGYKDLKLKAIKTLILEYEVETNKFLHSFGINEWQISYDITLENKTGSNFKRGFFVSVKNVLTDAIVSADSFSGGEFQRYKLAGTLGLISLLRRRFANIFNIIIFDESTQFLSTEGEESLIDILKGFCSKEQLVGFLIDHRNLVDHGFNDVFTVVKDQEGSKIQC